MGFRFRKSIKTGPFRVNFSKSGIGYSAGSKGFRYTKKANGGTRTTVGIPGTGLSYVKDRGKKQAKPKKASNASKTSIYTSTPSWTTSERWLNFCTIFWLIIFFPIGLMCMWAKASWKVATKITITLIFTLLTLLVILCIQSSDVDDPTHKSPNAETSVATQTPSTPQADTNTPPAAQDKYTVIDRFIELFNTTGPNPISNVVEMDIHGSDYRTEFRLNAFSNAVGKKGSISGGAIEIVNYGVWENNEFRIYAFADSIEASMDLYVTIVRAIDPSVSEAEISAWYHQYDNSRKVSFNLTTSAIVNTQTSYANGGVAGYDLMFDIPISSFMK